MDHEEPGNKMDQEDPGNKISRRGALKRIGVAGAAVAWSAPIVSSLRTPAYAQTRESPNCTQCGGACDPSPDCFCLTDEAGSFCSNNIFCTDLQTCDTSADCPPGWFCQQGDCFGNCGSNLCIPGCGVVALAEGATGPTNRR